MLNNVQKHPADDIPSSWTITKDDTAASKTCLLEFKAQTSRLRASGLDAKKTASHPESERWVEEIEMGSDLKKTCDNELGESSTLATTVLCSFSFRFQSHRIRSL